VKHTVFPLAVILMISGAPASSAAARLDVRVLDEEGRLLMRTRGLRLSRGRVGVPVSAYQRLGLVVTPDLRRRRIDVAVPASDWGVVFTLGSRRMRDFFEGTAYPNRSNARLVRLHHGHFYVSAQATQEPFHELFVTSWNPRTQTVVLQRSRHLANRLEGSGSRER